MDARASVVDRGLVTRVRLASVLPADWWARAAWWPLLPAATMTLGNLVASLFYYLRVLGPVYFGATVVSVPLLGRWAGVAALTAAASPGW